MHACTVIFVTFLLEFMHKCCVLNVLLRLCQNVASFDNDIHHVDSISCQFFKLSSSTAYCTIMINRVDMLAVLGNTLIIAHYFCRSADPLHCIASANFEKQPPDNMRKSNFFHFIISLYDSQQRRVQVQKALFKDFFDTSIVCLYC